MSSGCGWARCEISIFFIAATATHLCNGYEINTFFSFSMHLWWWIIVQSCCNYSSIFVVVALFCVAICTFRSTTDIYSVDAEQQSHLLKSNELREKNSHTHILSFAFIWQKTFTGKTEWSQIKRFRHFH